LSSLTKVPNGIFYGQLKRDPYWEPLRRDPRYEKVLSELAPRDWPRVRRSRRIRIHAVVCNSWRFDFRKSHVRNGSSDRIRPLCKFSMVSLWPDRPHAAIASKTLFQNVLGRDVGRESPRTLTGFLIAHRFFEESVT